MGEKIQRGRLKKTFARLLGAVLCLTMLCPAFAGNGIWADGPSTVCGAQAPYAKKAPAAGYGISQDGDSGDSREKTPETAWSADFSYGTFLTDGGLSEPFDADDIEAWLNSLQNHGARTVSFRELMKHLVSGDLAAVFTEIGESIRDALFLEIKTNMGLMGQILTLALIGAVFSSFSSIFGPGHVSETGFYVIYLLVITFLAASFFASVSVADKVFGEILEFMRVLLPAYFMAVAMAGGAITSSAMCGFTFGAIGLVQAVFTRLLVPLIRVYIMMVFAGNLYREDMISRMTGLLRQFILWTMKTMFGVIVGFHLIQGLILPQADALKNASITRAVELIPGIGAGAGAVSQIVMGSGILIKNTAGAAAVLVLIVLAAVPVIKLLVLMALYHVTAAIIQPVCDKRLVTCIFETASGHGLLLKMVGYSLALFSVTVAILCVSTNAAYYAG